jgi:hypothetical protein
VRFVANKKNPNNNNNNNTPPPLLPWAGRIATTAVQDMLTTTALEFDRRLAVETNGQSSGRTTPVSAAFAAAGSPGRSLTVAQDTARAITKAALAGVRSWASLVGAACVANPTSS